MNIKKAILTGGGRATRLWPITTTVNKHLLPLANKPMIFHAIEKVVQAGIEEIFINTNPGDTELPKQVGDGSRWGVKITFFEQTGGPQGIAHVVNEAHQFIGDEPFMFYLSDNILLGSIRGMVEEFESGNYDCMLALSTVKDPERFGVPIFDDAGRLVDVWEKPKNPPNNFAVTGIYLYNSQIFFDAFRTLKKSDRGEYEISDIHSQFLKSGKRVGYREITGYWKDTGKPDDLLIANQLLMDDLGDDVFRIEGTLAPGAEVVGRVSVGPGTTIGPKTKLIGPVVIGENCIIDSAAIGPYTSIGAASEIRGAGVKDTIALDHVKLVGGMNITHSLIGKNATIVKLSPTPVAGEQQMILGDKSMIEW